MLLLAASVRMTFLATSIYHYGKSDVDFIENYWQISLILIFLFLMLEIFKIKVEKM